MHILSLLRKLGLDPASDEARRVVGGVRDSVRWCGWDWDGAWRGPDFEGKPFFADAVELCINGQVAASGAYFGQDVRGIVDHLLGQQLPDGGWNCEATNFIHIPMMLLHHLQSTLDRLIHEQDLPGVSAAVSVDGVRVWTGGSGLADIEGQDVMSPRHRLVIYSITKSMIAVATLRLVQRGALDLDQPIGKWFPDWPALAAVTLRQALNHTGGIPDYGPLASYHAAVRETPATPWSFGAMLQATLGQGLLSPPGQVFRYSNPGYALLKRLLEQATGKTLREVLKEEVFEPLGLTSAGVVEGPADMETLAAGYTRMFSSPGAARQDMRGVYHPGWVAHGLVAATAEDVVRFFDGLFGGALLDAAGLAEMTRLTPVPEAAPPPHGWGYGLGLMGNSDTPWGPVYGHEGGGPGYSAATYHAPHGGGLAASVCALVNTDAGADARALVFGLMDGLAGRIKDPKGRGDL